MNPFSYLYDMLMEKEYFKNYRGFEGVVLKITLLSNCLKYYLNNFNNNIVENEKKRQDC